MTKQRWQAKAERVIVELQDHEWYGVDPELAWVMGVLEGEGSFILANQSSGKYAGISMQTIDKDILERIQDRLGGKVYGPYNYQGEGYKPLYHWWHRGRGVTEAIMLSMYPYMSPRRQKQILNVLKNSEARFG